MTDRDVEIRDGSDDGDSSDRRLRRAFIRRWLTIFFVGLTAISVTVSTVAIWAHRTVFDTDSFMEVVGPALEDPAFYDAVSEQVSDGVLDALDLETRIEDGLSALDDFLSSALIDALDLDVEDRRLLQRFDRPGLASLAPAITEAIEGVIADTIDDVITSDEFRALLPVLVEEIHRAAVALIEGDPADLENVYIEDGEVRLNLIPTIAEVLRRVADEIRDFLPDVQLPDAVSNRVGEGIEQVGSALGAELPADFGQVTIMSEGDFDEIRDAGNSIDRLVWGIVLATVLLVVATIAISATRRRTVVQLGIGIALGLVVGWIIIAQVRDAVVDGITDPNSSMAAARLFDELLTSLGTAEWLVAIVALSVALVAYLAGGPAWLESARDWFDDQVVTDEPSDFQRWVAGHHDALRIAGAAVAVVIVLLVGFSLAAVVIVGVILAGYLWALASLQRAAGRGEPASGDSHDASVDA